MLSSNQPDDGGRETDSSEEVASGLVVASCYSAIEFEFGEEVLNQVTSFIEFFVIFLLHFTVGLGWDDGHFASFLQRLQHAPVASKPLSASIVLAPTRGNNLSAPSRSQACPPVR